MCQKDGSNVDDSTVKISICKNGSYLYNKQYISKKLAYVAYVKHKVYCSLGVPLHKGTHLHTHEPPMAAFYASVLCICFINISVCS